MARYIDIDDFRKNAYYADTDLDIGVYLAEHGCADVVPRADFDRVARELERVEALYFAKDTQLENAKAEVANKICCEIEEEIVAALESNYRALKEWDDGRCNDYILEMVNRIKGKIDALRGMKAFVEELKKKYTEGQK